MEKKNIMIKLQDLLLKKPIIDITRHMYYRSPSKIEVGDDGSVILHKSNYYDFFTFYNSFPIGIFSKYTIAKKYYLVLEIKGDFKVELFGHMSKKSGYQKEWLGVYTYKNLNKKKVVIPISSDFSDIVSFGIWCFGDSYIYEAYYAADVEEEDLSESNIHIVLSSDSEEKDLIEKTVRNTIQSLETDEEFKDCFTSEVISANASDIPSADALKMPGDTKNIIFAKDTFISDDTLRRTHRFFSILKKEYNDTCLIGTIIDIANPNIGLTDFVADAKEDDDNDPETHKTLDLNVFSSLIENNGEKKIKSTFPEISGFVCMPRNVWSEKNKIKNITKNHYIRLNGLSAYANGILKSFAKKNKKTTPVKEDTYKLQDILFDTEKSIEVTRHMYYRSPAVIEKSKNGTVKLPGGQLYDFFTYFNSFSLEKWKKYTHLGELYLVLEVKGSFDIDLFGHYKNKTGYQKEFCGKHTIRKEEKELVILKFPKGLQSSLVAFSIFAQSDVFISKAYYSTDVDEKLLRTPLITMVTTTFKKEDYVQKNIDLLSEHLLNEDEYQDHFIWNIIDNGRTFEPQGELSDKIRLFENRNVGGAGGFARGMMESLIQNEKADYILLMDDDVVFIPESFKRLYKLLSMLKDEYKKHFISGAMLKMGQPNVQHEDTGRLISDGYHEAVKPNYDLNLWDHIIDNEVIRDNVEHQYGAWWFCCIPVGIARLDNLPLPVFVRGDDVEYSLRNNAKFITMNGICIWHEGFEGKFSAALEFYQVNRNELAVRAMHPELHDVDCIGHIKIIFWEEVYKFNYRGASLLLDAVEDYMKGPEFYKKLDGEKSMKAKRKKDHNMKPITPDIAGMIDLDTLYEYKAVPPKLKKIYDYTYNGQARIPEMLLKKKTGVIPYGWGYFPGKMCLTEKNIAVDATNETYTVYKKDRNKFNKIKARYDAIMNKYNLEHKRIEKEYQDSLEVLTGKDFWGEYLNI